MNFSSRSDLKQVIIIPIHKSGDKSDISNYRPISLLPTISNIGVTSRHYQQASMSRMDALLLNDPDIANCWLISFEAHCRVKIITEVPGHDGTSPISIFIMAIRP